MIAIALALLASLGWGASDFLGGITTRSLPLRAVVTGMMAGGLLTAALMALVTQSPYPGGDLLLAAVIAGLASMTAVSSLYKALAIGSMSVVSPISAAYPVVPVMYGLARGERPSLLQLGGMVLIFAGVIAASYVREGRTKVPAGVGVVDATAEAVRRGSAARRSCLWCLSPTWARASSRAGRRHAASTSLACWRASCSPSSPPSPAAPCSRR